MNNREKYNMLKKYKEYIVIEQRSNGYANFNVVGHIKKECPYNFTMKELMLLLDDGMLPFGGRGNLASNDDRDRFFNVTIYTD